MTIGHKALEDFRKVFRHLFESELESFVFSVFQRDHKFFDLIVTVIQLFFSFKKLRLFLGERDELIQSFFVDVAE